MSELYLKEDNLRILFFCTSPGHLFHRITESQNGRCPFWKILKHLNHVNLLFSVICPTQKEYKYFPFFLSMLGNLTQGDGMLYICSNYPTFIFNENLSTDFCVFSHCMFPSPSVPCCWFSPFWTQWISTQQYYNSFQTSFSLKQDLFLVSLFVCVFVFPLWLLHFLCVFNYF